MSEIKLKVPAEPKAESAGQGNFKADLVPNSTIEVKNRAFADYLINEFGLTEIKPKVKAQTAKEESPFAAGYHPRMPGRDALIAAEIPFETLQGLTREQLIKLPDIGAKTADAILSFSPTAPVENPDATGDQIPPAGNDGANVGGDQSADASGGAGDNSTNENSNDGGAE